MVQGSLDRLFNAFASNGSARETVGETYLIVLILLGHGLLLGLSFAFVPMVLEPDLHLQREGESGG